MSKKKQNKKEETTFDLLKRYTPLIFGVFASIGIAYGLFWLGVKGAIGIVVGMGIMAMVLLSKNVFIQSMLHFAGIDLIGTHKTSTIGMVKNNDEEKNKNKIKYKR